MKSHSLLSALGASMIILCAASAPAAEKKAPAEKPGTPAGSRSDFTRGLTEGKPIFDARYRYEYVDQDGLADEATAQTIRTRLGYETGTFRDFSALVEFENITDIGGKHYNDTLNGKITYPTVADPEDTALNRLQLTYKGVADTTLALGRQLINLDNQRFVGGIGWRQNDQTFNAISVKNSSFKDTTLYYAYANQVNRIFGTDSPVGKWDNSHIHLINASYAGLSCGKITGYSYLLDIPDSVALSSATYGARFEGKHPIAEAMTGLLSLEYAHQTDYADNPNNISFNYFSIEPGVTYAQWTLKGQYVRIEGDGARGMQFALGTNHAFNGWVDKFLTTPANGLVDVNLGVTYVAKSENTWLNGVRAMLVYHDFSAERGSADYGTEWNASVEQTFQQSYTAGIKLGAYDADALYTDTVKIMPYLQVKF